MEDTQHTVALDSHALSELNSTEARALLDTVDSLRELQVGDIVNLPQIIVVGDQSSGKSSVLEAISRVRFPTRGDICTRFATELVLRRAAETKISVTIDSAHTGSSRSFKRTSFNKDALPDIITEATESMGIRPGSTKGFSEDILRVEIADPDVYPLTLVDLPGFFHSETADQTKEGRNIVRQLAQRYMKQTKSIILAVVSANHNLANQLVVEEARRHDPDRERTLGVITKPDLTSAGSQDEKKCLQLVRGQESIHKLRLGWHVLRNKSEGKESSSVDDRDAEESFFQSGAWASIPPSSRGISQLRKKLSKVLLEHIQKTLPGLVNEIETNLSVRQRALDLLGKPRSETEDLRTYLLEISDKFRRLVLDGMSGQYGDEFFGDLYVSREARKLRSVIRRLNRAFHATLLMKGVHREILWDDEASYLDNGGIEWLQNEELAPEYLKPYLKIFDEFPKPVTITEKDLSEELGNLGAANQGTEFPALPNAQLGYRLFRKQAEPWGPIAGFYIEHAAEFAKCYVEEVFTHIIGVDKQTTDRILRVFVLDFFAKKQEILKNKLEEIIRPYQYSYGPPLDAEFHSTLSARTVGREAWRIATLLEEEFPNAFSDKGGKGLDRETIEGTIRRSEKSRISEFGTERVIDMAMTHYEMSLKTFAENVVNLAVENCLISDLPTILTPSMVIRMSEDELKHLVSESEEVQAERLRLQHEVKILGEGLKKCQKSRLHERTVLPEQFKYSVSPRQASGQISRSIKVENSSPQPDISASLASAASQLSLSSLQPSAFSVNADPISASRPFSHLVPKPWPEEENTRLTQNTWTSPWPTKKETSVLDNRKTPDTSVFVGSLNNYDTSQSAGLFGDSKPYSGRGGGLFGSTASNSPNPSSDSQSLGRKTSNTAPTTLFGPRAGRRI